MGRNYRKDYVLLNPGPVLISPQVRRALTHQPICHRDSDFSELFGGVQEKLLKVFRARRDYSIVMVSGSGTAAMEMTLASVIPKQGKLLVLSNGCFGERFAQIAVCHQIETVQLRAPWGMPLSLADLESQLAQDPDICAVAMVHHETSVGLLNPIGPVGAIVKKHGRLFIVDCIASLGAEDIDVERDQIDLCIGTANKCLHGIAGISFVCVSGRVWPLIREIPPRSYYLDLKKYHDYALNLQQTPYTPPVNLIMALNAALDELLQQGLAGRAKRYRDYSGWLRKKLEGLGLEIVNNHGSESHTVTCLRLPEGLDFKILYESLKKDGFIIYGGKDELTGKIFQVSNMGELSPAMLKRFARSLERILKCPPSR